MNKLTVVLIVGALVITGCSDSTGPDSKKDSDDTTVLVSEIIGAAGGTVETEEVSLIVPSGSFDSNNELKLSVTEDESFGDHAISKTYRIEGVPYGFSDSLEIRIKYEGSLSGETFMAIGEEVRADNPDDREIEYTFILAVELDGYLVCNVPPTEGGLEIHSGNLYRIAAGNEQALDLILHAQVITGYTTTYSRFRNFYFHYPVYLDESVNQLAGYLEKAYDVFQGMGFKYKLPPLYDEVFEKEIYVKIKNFKGENNDYLGKPSLKIRLGRDTLKSVGFKIDFNETQLGLAKKSEMEIAAGKIFFDTIRFMYTVNTPENLEWFFEAANVWCEEKFAEQGYIPDGFKTNQSAPLNGLSTGTKGGKESRLNYGRGMSTLIKYLVKRYGEDILLKIYEEISSKTPSTEALFEVIPDSPADWWNGFIRDYVSGKTYAINSTALMDKESGSYTISAKSDTSKMFVDDYKDLSAKIYRINLNYKDIDSSSKITFTLMSPHVKTEDMRVTVFKLKNSLEYLGQDATVTVSDIRDLTDQGYDLVAVVTNSHVRSPYTQTSDIGLEIKVKTSEDSDLSKYTRGNVRVQFVKVYGTYENSKQFTEGTLYSSRVDGKHVGKTGTWSGNTFSASWDEFIATWDDLDNHWSIGTMTITVDETGDNITEFAVEQTSIYNNTDGSKFTYNTHITWMGSKIQKDNSSQIWNENYIVNGMQACDYLSIYIKHTFEYSDYTSILKYNSKECVDYSRVSVGFLPGKCRFFAVSIYTLQRNFTHNIKYYI